MGKQIHFIVSSELGLSRSFVLSTSTLNSIALICLCLVLAGVGGLFLFGENISMRKQVAQLEAELQSTLALNRKIQEQASQHAENQQTRLDRTLAELKERSELIDSILSRVGVSLKTEQGSKGVGGPFRSQLENPYQDFTMKVDRSLDAVRSVPLGPPVQGVITSQFGPRIDPINRRSAFHGGIDIRGGHGSIITAPADGVVSEQGYAEGFGNFIEIDHGNTFRTRYYHLAKKLVSTGTPIRKGQAIALMGNSGRSTGTHLHYEIRYRNRPVDPIRFVQIQQHIRQFQANERGES